MDGEEKGTKHAHEQHNQKNKSAQGNLAAWLQTDFTFTASRQLSWFWEDLVETYLQSC